MAAVDVMYVVKGLYTLTSSCKAIRRYSSLRYLFETSQIYLRVPREEQQHNRILVPRAHDPFGLRQGSRPLAGTEAGSPRITDFRLLCAASEI